MSNTLSSFDPFATHPFTSGQSQPSDHVHHTSSTRTPALSPNGVPLQGLQSAQSNSTYSNTASNSSSLPPPQTSVSFPVAQSPQPRLASKWPAQSSSSQPVFTPWKQERSSTPELSDVLAKKKSSTAWPANAVYVSKEGDSLTGASGR